MTPDGILKLAREAGGYPTTPTDRALLLFSESHLERFAVLIEKHLSYDGIHTCSDQCQRPACVATRRAVAIEREECAKVCDEHWRFNGSASECADAIRARGKA